MRGSQSEVFVRLKEHFSNIVDIDGCTLLHMYNVSKHACQELGNDIEELVRDIYCHCKYSLSQRQQLHTAAHIFGSPRFMETKWLQIQCITIVVERIIHYIV